MTQEYNIAKLKHAQTKFEKSKELNDFMYGKQHPKLAHLLSLDSAVKLPKYDNNNAERYELETPFGSVWVGDGKYGNGRVISLKKEKEEAPTYNAMCTNLDWYFDRNKNNICSIDDAINGIIEPIIKYINQPLTGVQHFLGTTDTSQCPSLLFKLIKSNYKILPNMIPYYKRSAAFLCGVLLLSESHELRNPTGGKFERKAMKNVLRLAKNGCVNPFSKVFLNDKGRYIPARVGGMRETAYIIDVHAIPRRFIYLSQEMEIISQKILAAFFCVENARAIFMIKTIEGGSYKSVINVQGAGDITAANVRCLEDKFTKQLERPFANYKAVNVLRNSKILLYIRNVKINYMLSKLLQIEKFKAKIEGKKTVDIDDFPAALEELKQTILESLKHKKPINKLMNNQV